MIKGSTSENLEYAILKLIRGFQGQEDTHVASFPDWQKSVEALLGPDQFTRLDLKSAFKRLCKQHFIGLTKAGVPPYTYTEDEEQDVRFFYREPFYASITDDGRSHWDRLNYHTGSGVFISHITEEKPVAHVLQKYLKLAFGDAFRVFVSSDAKSIGGGKKWYTHIIDNLRLSEVVLVLVSQESKGREWINFEAGFGEGSESLVVPVAIKNMSLGQLSNPVAGIQGRKIDDIGLILDDIGNRIGTPHAIIDGRAYLAELQDAEAQLIYKSVKVEPVVAGNQLQFDIENVGNTDVELLMLEAYVPHAVLDPLMVDTLSMFVPDNRAVQRVGVLYRHCSCYSQRGVYGNIPPNLRPIITPSMGRIRPTFDIPITKVLADDLRDNLSIFFQLHAIGYRTEEEERKIADIPSWR